MTILMKQDKSLVISHETRIYQKENVVDILDIYIPSSFFDIIAQNVPGFTTDDLIATMYYVTQTNDAYTEILNQQESEKEGYLYFKLPVTTKFTSSAGQIVLEMSFVYYDEGSMVQYVLHSGQLKDITVLSWEDYYRYIPNDSLAVIDNKIAELQNKIDELKAIEEALEMTVPNELLIDKDMLFLAKDEEKISSGVEVVVPGDPDDEDEDHDGIIDLDDLPENASQGEGSESEGDTDTDSDSDSLEGETASYYYMEL